MPRTQTAPPQPIPAASPAGDDTDALTRAVARGDARAFGVLYERWFDRLHATAHRLTGRDEAFCLDVVQDCLLKAARRMPPLSSEAALASWLWRVVHRTALDHLRRERRRIARERGARPPESTLPVLDERIAWLRSRIDELPAEDRGLLAARFAHGLTLDQIGTDAGTTGDAAHGRLRRTLARLRKAAEDAP